MPNAELFWPRATAFGPNAALLTPVAWPRKPTATAKSLVAEDEVPMAMLPCPQSSLWVPPVTQGCVASAVSAKLSGPMAIPPMALANAAPASESLIPTAANPGARPFPRVVSASPGLETNDCSGTIAPMASSTAIWLTDMRDMVTPLRLSPIGRATPAVGRCKAAVVTANGRTDKTQGYPASTQASNHRLMSCACQAAQQLCRFPAAFEQRLGADQVGRAEAFREPIINGLQQPQGFLAATLFLPEAHEIACRAELPGQGLLPPRSFQALDEQVLDFVGCGASGRLQQARLDPQHLGDGPAFAGLVRNGESFFDDIPRGF